MDIPFIGFEEGETLKAEVPVWLNRGWDMELGTLFITDRRVRFESARFNGHRNPREDRLGNVLAAVPFNTFFGLLPNGMRIETRGGGTFRFVVKGRQGLIELIQEGTTKARRIGKRDPVGGAPSIPVPGV